MIPQEITESLKTFFSTQYSVEFRIHSDSSLSGGCINHVYRLQTNLGNFCLKYNRKDAFPGMFENEARGLLMLKETGEIRVPGVVHTGSGDTYSYLLLEYITPGKPVPAMMDDLGHSLARLHLHSAEYFGNDHDNYIGSLPQSNHKHTDWVSFFIEERLEKQVQMAQVSGFFSTGITSCFTRLYRRLNDIFPKENPAILHGDLWGGNYMVAENGRACLIDPAVYYGHREMDLAMTRLFGGFDYAFYTSYQEIYLLEKGWESRVDICKLYPLLIHLNIFGSGYLGQIESIARKF